MGRESRARQARHAAGRELVAKVVMRDGETRVEYLPDDPATAARVLLAGLNAVLTKLEPKAATAAPAGKSNGSGIVKPKPGDLRAVERTKARN